MAQSADICFLSATELVAAFRAQRLSPVECTDAVLKRIDQLNPAVNAFFHLDAEGARKAARASEARWKKNTPVGSLDGVPFSVKDHVLTEGMPSPWGVPGEALGAPGEVDAPIVARLREAGAILLGKTTQPQFAMFASGANNRYGIPRNPWDLSKTPGGSSAGAAAALASGMGPIAVGSDGGGSIRMPASYTGVVGHKPTFGRVPFFPPFGPGVVYGPMTRSVEDIALTMNVVTKPDWRDIWALPPEDHDYLADLHAGDLRGLRIAYSEWFGFGTRTTAEVSRAVRAGLDVLRGMGATAAEIPAFFDFDPYKSIAASVFPGLHGMAAMLVGTDTQRLLPEVQRVLKESAGITLQDFMAGKSIEAQIRMQMAAALKDFDILVTPTMPTTAFGAERCFPEGATLDAYGYSAEGNPFTWPFNMTLQPAISVPCGLTAAGLPVGLQIVGQRGADALCIRVASAYERARGSSPPWPTPQTA